MSVTSTMLDPLAQPFETQRGILLSSNEGVSGKVIPEPAILLHELEHLRSENDILRHQLDLWQHAERDWNEKRHLFSIMTDHVQDMIALLDRTGMRTWSNHAWTRVLGYSLEELTHRTILDDIHEAEQGQFMQIFARVINSGRSERVEHRLQKVDGTWCMVESEVSAVIDDHGHVDCLILICRDITGRRQAEEEKISNRAMESVAQLAGQVAAEYQEFLVYVTANLTMAKNLNGPHNAVSVRLNEIERALRRVGGVTDRLLALTPKLATPEFEFKPQAVESLVRNAVPLLLRGTPCRPEFSFPAGFPLVEVCADSFGNAVRNVVKNAMEAMPQGGVIRVLGQVIAPGYFTQHYVPGVEAGHYLCLSFQDNGPGMHEETLARATEPYFTTKTGAQGLGLSNTQTILQQHKGALRIQSVIGVGTTVSFYLPLQVQVEEIKPTAAAVEAPRKLRALLMDDDEMLIDIVSRMLDNLGFEVVACRDGAQAIAACTKAKVSKNLFDVALLDLVIPNGINGIDAVVTLKKISPQTVYIACSGHFDHPAMQEPERYGFIAVLYKPYKLEKLQSIMNAAIQAAAGIA